MSHFLCRVAQSSVAENVSGVMSWAKQRGKKGEKSVRGEADAETSELLAAAVVLRSCLYVPSLTAEAVSPVLGL